MKRRKDVKKERSPWHYKRSAPAPLGEAKLTRADEIRAWATAVDRPNSRGELLFPNPPHPVSGMPGAQFARCAGEQRVIVEVEIAAQLAEMNENLRGIMELIRGHVRKGKG